MPSSPLGAIPASLVDALRSGTVVPFVGAGISSGVVSVSSGGPLYPSWSKLLEIAATRLDRESLPVEAAAVRELLAADPPDFYGAADRACASLGAIWATVLRENLDPLRRDADEASLEVARALWRLGSSLLITTNYDRVLGWAHPSPPDVQRWVLQAPAESAQFLRAGIKRPTVWHLHGHIDDVATLVLTREGYRKLYGDSAIASLYPAAQATIQSLLTGHSLLFVGFSFADAIFRQLFQHVWRVFGGFGGPHYVLARERDAPEISELLGDSAHVITFSEFGNPFLDLLAQLGASVGAPAWRQTPAFEPGASEHLSRQVHDAYARRRRLVVARQSTAEVDREIQALQQQLREGGTLKAGDFLDEGRYLLIERKGSGGFGVVWLADDQVRGVQVAIKVLHPEDARQPQRRERFYRGARSMAGIRHDNVVRVLAPPREEAGWHYYVMEYVPGGDLQGRAPLALLEAVALVSKIGNALHAAHLNGLVHRDVKPANILLDASSEPKLTDFDLVKTQTSFAKTRAEGLGAYGFAAPEALRDGSNVDARADIFSLAVTTLFLLAGPDVALEDSAQRANQLSLLDVAGAVKAALKRAMEFAPALRPASMQEFCEELEAASMPEAAELPPPSSGFDQTLRKWKDWSWTAQVVRTSLTVLMGLGLGIFFLVRTVWNGASDWWLADRAVDPKETAAAQPAPARAAMSSEPASRLPVGLVQSVERAPTPIPTPELGSRPSASATAASSAPAAPSSTAGATSVVEYPETVSITSKNNGSVATGFFGTKGFLIAPSLLFDGGNDVVATFADHQERPVELYRKAKTLPLAQVRLRGAAMALMAFTAKFLSRTHVRPTPGLSPGERIEIHRAAAAPAYGVFTGVGPTTLIGTTPALLLSVESRAGDMGAPVLDANGQVVGVFIGASPATRYAIAVKDIMDEFPDAF